MDNKSFAMEVLIDYKKANKRQFIIIIVILLMWFATIGYLVHILNDIGTIEETTSAMQNLGFNFDMIDFFVVANMMYNDYFDLVKDDETLALKLAKDWLNDEDSKENKLYCYWKYIVK